MNNRFNAIGDIDLLTPPKLIENLSEDEIVARLLDKFTAEYPEFSDQTEFDPVRALVHVAAYQELLLRQRINDAAAACLLATASGGDLDIHGWQYGVARKVLVEANPNASPPIEEVRENDDDYRGRIQLAWEGLSVAGPEGAYVFWAKTQEGVKDAAALSPAPAEVQLFILGEDGHTEEALLKAVKEGVDPKRPIADRVEYLSAEPVDFKFHARLNLRNSLPETKELILSQVKNNFKELLKMREGIGQSIPLGHLFAAITIDGVAQANIVSPQNGVEVQPHQFARILGEPVFEIV